MPWYPSAFINWDRFWKIIPITMSLYASKLYSVADQRIALYIKNCNKWLYYTTTLRLLWYDERSFKRTVVSRPRITQCMVSSNGTTKIKQVRRFFLKTAITEVVSMEVSVVSMVGSRVQSDASTRTLCHAPCQYYTRKVHWIFGVRLQGIKLSLVWADM